MTNGLTKQSEGFTNLQGIYECLVQKLHSGVIFVDQKLQIRYINDSARKLFNQPSEVKDRSLNTISPILTEKLAQWQKETNTNSSTMQFMLAEPDAIVQFKNCELDGEITALVIIDDKQRIVHHAQQLKLASLGRFTASIAHELRNPLGAIAHAAQLFNETEHLKREDRRLIEIITNNCDRMNKIIKNILQLSRNRKSEPDQFQLKEYLEKFVNDFLKYNKESVQISIQVIPDNMNIAVDRSQLTQILQNLCDNAAHYGKQKDGKVKIDLIAGADEDDNNYLLVKDYGPGIEKNQQIKVFEPFYTTSRLGIGMGLFISKELCEANQAKLTIDESNNGACFRISFNKNEELIYE